MDKQLHAPQLPSVLWKCIPMGLLAWLPLPAGLTLGTPPWLQSGSQMSSPFTSRPSIVSNQTQLLLGCIPPGKLSWNDVPREPGKCRGKEVALEVIRLQFSVRESFMGANLGDVERCTVKLMFLFFFLPSFLASVLPRQSHVAQVRLKLCV